MIFTLMNRAIQHAHAQMLRSQRRRFKSITDDAARHVRQSLRYLERTRIFSRNTTISQNSVERYPAPSTSTTTNINASVMDSLMSPTVSLNSEAGLEGHKHENETNFHSKSEIVHEDSKNEVSL